MPSLPAPDARSPAGSAVGFGLLETLVALGVLAGLAGMAAPAMQAVLQQRQVQAAAEALVADLRLARTQAVRRAAVVTVCASADGQACGPAAAWRQGWLVFADPNGNQVRDRGEDLIRVQEALTGLASVASASPSHDKAAFSFQPTGWARAASQTLLFSPLNPRVAARVVCISNQGRPSLRPAGVTACS